MASHVQGSAAQRLVVQGTRADPAEERSIRALYADQARARSMNDWRESGSEGMSAKQRRLLNAADFRALLEYEPESGRLIWKTHMTPRARKGKEAGVIQMGRYRRVGIYGFYYMAHRIAWLIQTGSWPENEIDHINGVCHDNRWRNLREATCRENKLNTLHRNNTGLAGASFCRRNGKYRSSIRTPVGEKKFLGYFATAEEAHEAYKTAAVIYHGEFARW